MVLLPVAIYLRFKVRREVAADPARYKLPNKLIDRPVLLLVGFWLIFFLVILGGTYLLGWLGISPV
jgi:hypothetical protein